MKHTITDKTEPSGAESTIGNSVSVNIFAAKYDTKIWQVFPKKHKILSCYPTIYFHQK